MSTLLYSICLGPTIQSFLKDKVKNSIDYLSSSFSIYCWCVLWSEKPKIVLPKAATLDIAEEIEKHSE